MNNMNTHKDYSEVDKRFDKEWTKLDAWCEGDYNLLKSFIHSELDRISEQKYQEGYAKAREEVADEIRNKISTELWNEDGSLKSHDVSHIVSTVIHQTILTNKNQEL